ncbi:MAG: hypothetical protein MZV64_58750 [Ignavibacteriales bacterium]|nr:hypothetical protein [Ignavibacteriales bacterium]
MHTLDRVRLRPCHEPRRNDYSLVLSTTVLTFRDAVIRAALFLFIKVGRAHPCSPCARYR